MIQVSEIIQLHEQLVARWHHQAVDNLSAGWLRLVAQQHGYNFLLWHEEDIARSPDVDDARIAQVKRAIDRFNQQRNDGIEQIDDWITEDLQQHQVVPDNAARLNSETPGSVIDRLSILSLRIFHLREQHERADATPEHIRSVQHKLAICQLQRDDLSTALAQLLEGIYAGSMRHRTYRQFKMYNDPTLNPYLYQSAAEAEARRAG